MAIACFLLITTPPFPPLPDRNVPCFLRRIALLTDLLAARPYLAMIASNLRETALRMTIAIDDLPHDRQLSANFPTNTCTPTEVRFRPQYTLLNSVIAVRNAN